jgi:NADH dehydrogenase FAD-containing subunit
MSDQRRVLVIGGGFAGFVVARHMRHHYKVTVIDAKEYFEYTPGILRAFVHPSHLTELTFMYQPVLEGKMGVKFLWGEVMKLDGEKRECEYKRVETGQMETIGYDYCVVACGCNFGLFEPLGESLWFPTVWEKVKASSKWKEFDERYWQGRRDHIQQEYEKLGELNKKKGSILIVGAGFIGVEWATEIDYFFPDISVALCDMLPKCLGPLPENAKDYCQKYMDKKGIKSVYGVKFNPNNPDYNVLGISQPDLTYIATGFKASCWFMPIETMTQYSGTEDDHVEKDMRKKGPAGGGWIRTDIKLQVLTQNGKGENVVYAPDDMGYSRIFAVGDCNMLADLKPIPKISYPGEEQAAVACRQIEVIDSCFYDKKSVGWSFKPKQWPIMPCYGEYKLTEFWWPWGSGMFATSLGVNDACFRHCGQPRSRFRVHGGVGVPLRLAEVVHRVV